MDVFCAHPFLLLLRGRMVGSAIVDDAFFCCLGWPSHGDRVALGGEAWRGVNCSSGDDGRLPSLVRIWTQRVHAWNVACDTLPSHRHSSKKRKSIVAALLTTRHRWKSKQFLRTCRRPPPPPPPIRETPPGELPGGLHTVSTPNPLPCPPHSQSRPQPARPPSAPSWAAPRSCRQHPQWPHGQSR